MFAGFCLIAFVAPAQTNTMVTVKTLADVNNEPGTNISADTGKCQVTAQRVEAVRAVCIQSRRIICGEIIMIFPDGIVVDSGYTNLLCAPLNQS